MSPAAQTLEIPSVDEASAALEKAHADRQALLDRASAGAVVKPGDLSNADASVSLAELRLQAAHTEAARLAETERQSAVDRLRQQWIATFDEKGAIAANLDAATRALIDAISAARDRNVALEALAHELAVAGELADGESATRRRHTKFQRPTATIAGRSWTGDMHGDNAALLAAEVAFDAITAVYDGKASDVAARITKPLVGMVQVRLSEEFRR